MGRCEGQPVKVINVVFERIIKKILTGVYKFSLLLFNSCICCLIASLDKFLYLRTGRKSQRLYIAKVCSSSPFPTNHSLGGRFLQNIAIIYKNTKN